MKKSLVLASLLALGTSSFAMDVKPFVGLDLSNASADVKETASVTAGTLTFGGNTIGAGSSDSVSYSSSDTTPAFKFGAILNENHRVYGKYAKYDGKNSSKLTITTINYDYLFTNVKNDYNVTPYIGANIGQAKLDTSGPSGTGTMYGIQAGAIVPIKNNFEADFSLGYSKFNTTARSTVTGVNGNFGSFTATNASLSYDVKVENAIIFNVGFNYKF